MLYENTRNQNSKIKSFKARDFNSCVLEQVNVDLLNCESKKHLMSEYNSYHKGSGFVDSYNDWYVSKNLLV